nr:MAG TPA: hypothetical protein [Caudoviricetes sp.]
MYQYCAHHNQHYHHAIIPSNVMGFFIGDICQKSTL